MWKQLKQFSLTIQLIFVFSKNIDRNKENKIYFILWKLKAKQLGKLRNFLHVNENFVSPVIVVTALHLYQLLSSIVSLSAISSCRMFIVEKKNC